MARPRSLSVKLGAIGSALLAVALLSIGLTLWVTWQLQGGAAAVNEAGRMRMQAWRLAQSLAHEPPARREALMDEFDRSLELLRSGDPGRPLFVPRDESALARFDEVQADWARLRERWSPPSPPAAGDAAPEAAALVARIDAFVTAIESRLAAYTNVLNAFQFVLFALLIASAVTMLYSAYLLVFNPLARLQTGLARMREGDFAARVEVGADDEFGAVSAGFNRMAETLQGLYQNLEAKVADKTRSLQVEHQRLAALYEAAASVVGAKSAEALGAGFARQIRTLVGADASAVRWSDETNRRYVLLAADGLGEDLLEQERCLPTGTCFCGQASAAARTQVVHLRTRGEAARAEPMLGHCRRAGFETVIGVPVRLQDRMVGEFNLFFRRPATLGDDDRALLEALAVHLAGGIEGLRARALEREGAIAGERSLLARELHDSIAQSLAFMKIQVGLLRQAMQRDDGPAIERAVDELAAGVHESTADVRELLVHFRTRTNEEDIAPALQATLRKFEHQTGLPTHLSIRDDGLALPADVQVQVLHVVQEALSNVRKHAQATAVWVDVQQQPHWRIEVRDDGLGMDPATGRDETRVGLRIMRERAARIGAEVDLHSAIGDGTTVVLTLPALPEPALEAPTTL